jgi:putative DNA primase/helicase
MTTQTTGLITLTTGTIPDELRDRRQWVCWRLEERDGSWTKVPYVALVNGARRASSTDLLSWRTFDFAIEAFENSDAPPYDGIGYVFSSTDPYTGIDCDGCRNPETGELAPWAQDILGRVGDDAYVEVSPSATGIHIIVEGTVRGGGMRKGPTEMYSERRFFAITGCVL